MTEKKYTGYGYHGGGRKPSSPDGQPRRTTMTISGTKTEIETIRKLAKNVGQSVSRYVIERVLECCDNLEKILDDRPQLSIDRDGNLTFDSCENCEYITKRLGERDGIEGWIMQCKIGHPCTGYACQHYKSRYGEENIK